MRQVKYKGRNCFEIECLQCKSPIYKRVSEVLSSSDEREYRCNKCTIRHNMVKSGYVAPLKYTKNEQFFSFENLSLKSCYWAGFIAADGCINTGRASKTISIKISNKDRHLLDAFLTDVNSTNPVLKCTGQDQSRVSIRSEEWVKDLNDVFNIKPRKSMTHEPPKIHNEEFIKAFIIGYIDGDGSICFIGKDKYLKLSICGTSQFLLWIKSYFDQWTETTKAEKSIQYNKNGTENVCEYILYGKRALQVINILKDIPIDKLPRKWDKV